ncbi:hypothetical protein GNY98_23435 [Escherichia coli]|uniref:hypothetical protein n=1 Tax=Escherichia coli TaxID=562 RepID=UPI0012DBF041|nr:hypothetical protein [Escherichia coli]MUM95584.1 hypothetical protein [Escherichia coli]
MMINLIDNAFCFYKKHIFDIEKINLLESHNLRVSGSVPSVMWELFASILTNNNGKDGYGADLHGWEVKSSIYGSSYEYQYHLNTGLEKLHDDCNVNHLFCSYSSDYKNVIVKAISGKVLSRDYFHKWIPEYQDNYKKDAPKNERRQRFRKSIPFGVIQKNGTTILEIKDSVIIYRNDDALNAFNSDRL